MTTYQKASLNPREEMTNMNTTHPNPRRTSPIQESQRLLDGRKRQKLSHSPDNEALNRTARIAYAPAHAARTQESGSSDQSASRWFKDANDNVGPVQSQPSALDGTLSRLPSAAPRNFADTLQMSPLFT